MAGLGFTNLAAAQKLSKSDKAVLLVWLGGGPTHVETFDPKPEAPDEFRSVSGYCGSGASPILLGGNWINMCMMTDRMNVVHSFSHVNNSHARATHYVMTGTNTNEDQKQSVPSPGQRASGG